MNELYALPDGWEWKKLEELTEVITKGTTPTTNGYSFLDKGINFLKIENIIQGEINLNSIDKFISDEANQSQKRSALREHDVLFSIAGTIGDTAQLLEPLKLSRADISNVDRNFKYNRDDYIKSSKTIGGENDSFNTVREHTKENAINENGQIQDANTGLWHDVSEMDLDHNKSLKNFHNDGGFMLNNVEKREFGADSDNHDFTHNSTNRSKGSQDHKDFSDSEKNKEKYNLDNRRTNATHKRGQKASEKYIPSGKLEKTIFVTKSAAQDGVKVGTSQGLQQALGILLSEFITATFSEVKDIFTNGWKNGKYDDSWIGILKIRMEKIKEKLLGSWKNVAIAFGTGALSGLITAIITALINMFVRTGKNIVQLIREGFMSLMKAIKTLLFPPNNMDVKQATHEATKILSTGLVITGGILARESISTMLNGIPFADTISTALAGLISGLGSLLVVFMLDKLDMFGVNEDERHEFIMGTLEARITSNIAECDSVYQRIMST